MAVRIILAGTLAAGLVAHGWRNPVRAVALPAVGWSVVTLLIVGVLPISV